MIHFATIGSGFVVDWMLAAAKYCPDFVLTGAYSRTQERADEFAAKHGAEKTYTDLNALCQDATIEAVYVASPNLCHKEQAIMLLNAGKHVLCEKPMALSEGDLMEMAEAAYKNDVVLMEAMRPSHSPGVKMLRELFPRIGKVRRATLQFCQYSSRYDNFRRGIIENAFNPTLGNGALMDIGIYCVHMMEMLFGMPRSLTGASVFLHTGVDGEGTLLANYSDMLCEIVYSKIAQAMTPSQIQGEDGSLLFDSVSVPKNITLLPRGGERIEIPVPMGPGGDMVFELEDFIHQIQNKSMDRDILQHSYQSVCLLDRARDIMGVDFQKKGTQE